MTNTTCPYHMCTKQRKSTVSNPISLDLYFCRQIDCITRIQDLANHTYLYSCKCRVFKNPFSCVKTIQKYHLTIFTTSFIASYTQYQDVIAYLRLLCLYCSVIRIHCTCMKESIFLIIKLQKEFMPSDQIYSHRNINSTTSQS